MFKQLLISFLPVNKIHKIPAWNNTSFPLTSIFSVDSSKQLHSNHSKDTDNEAHDKEEETKRQDCVLYNSEQSVERLPVPCQSKYS